MTYEGDPKLVNTGDGTDLNVSGGQPEMDAGIANAVHLSIFTASDWWGNSLAKSDSERYTSEFDSINRRTLTNQTRLDAAEYAKSSLAWMVSEGIASEIVVEATIPAIGILGLVVKVVRPEATTIVRYQINWSEFALIVGVA